MMFMEQTKCGTIVHLPHANAGDERVKRSM